MKNFCSSSAKAAANAIEDTAEAAAKAERAAADINPRQLTAKEYQELQRFRQGMADGHLKVTKLKEAQQKIARSSGPAKAQARAEYAEIANQVWTDKNVLRQLQAFDDPYAVNLRAEFNRYRTQRYARIQEDALDRVAKATGRPREELYVMNASSNSEAEILAGSKVPNDLDVTIAQKVYDQPKIDPVTKKLGN